MKWATFLMTGVLIGACVGHEQKSLSESAEEYSKALYRGEKTILASYVHPDYRADFFRALERQSGLRISLAETDQVVVDEVDKKGQGLTGMVSLKMEYFRPEDLGLVENIRFYRWVFDKKSEQWQLAERDPLGQSRPPKSETEK